MCRYVHEHECICVCAQPISIVIARDIASLTVFGNVIHLDSESMSAKVDQALKLFSFCLCTYIHCIYNIYLFVQYVRFFAAYNIL